MNYDISTIMEVLKSIKPGFFIEEHQIHSIISEAFDNNKIEYIHEFAIDSKNRIDFMVGNIGIEVKKSKPYKKNLVEQLGRYTQSNAVYGIIVIIEKTVKLPKTINNKPIYTLVLNNNWGIAL